LCDFFYLAPTLIRHACLHQANKFSGIENSSPFSDRICSRGSKVSTDFPAAHFGCDFSATFTFENGDYLALESAALFLFGALDLELSVSVLS